MSVGLPGDGTDEGALAWLFLDKVLVPDTDDMRDVGREMDMMHCVLINRLKHPSDFAAGSYAFGITQIITAREDHVQFQGFENYPILGGFQRDQINAVLNISLDRNDSRNSLYTAFVKTAVIAAKTQSPIDPTATGLYVWVTSGAPRPSNDAVLFQTIGGNDFYTWSKSKPKGSR